MNVEITPKKRKAIHAFLVDNLNFTIAKIASDVGCDQSTMSRILNGKTKTMNPFTYNRLEHLFLREYLPVSELIEFDPDETVLPKVSRSLEYDVLKKEIQDLRAELKRHKQFNKKLLKMIGEF